MNISRNVFSLGNISTFRFHLILNRNLIRNTSKIATELDEEVLTRLETEEIKPRHHPGIIKANLIELPPQISNALQRVIGDYPIKSILSDGKRLNQYISSRHPPPDNKQIRDKLRDVIKEINERMPPKEITELNESDSIQWRRKREQAIHKMLGERTYTWKPIEYGAYEAIVYAIVRGAREYAILTRIMLEIQTRHPNFKPSSFFDFGSGVGTGMWACSNLWKKSIFEYYNVDSSRDMNDLSELILCDGIENKEITLRNVYYRQFLPALDTKYDLVLSAFSLFELPTKQARQDVLMNLWQKCEHYLIIVEEGTRRGSELVNEARNLILNQKDESLIGHVFAPCPHALPCPRLNNENDNTPCNFESSYVPLRLGIEGHLPKLTARYSYIVLKKGSIEDSTQNWPRLVRPTLARSGHIICRMCTASAKLQEVIFTQSKHGRMAYRCAKSSRWGDRLPMKIGEPYDKKIQKNEEGINVEQFSQEKIDSKSS